MQIIKAPKPDGNDYDLKVIECNLRASRSFPFSSKVLGVNFVDIATKAITGVPTKPVDLMANNTNQYVATKVPQFSWTRLAGADPFLGVEMSSTGEVASFGANLVDAYWASLRSTMNHRTPEPGEGLLFGGDISAASQPLVKIVDYLAPLGYKFFCAEKSVGEFLESKAQGGVKVQQIDFPLDNKQKLR